MSPQMPAAGKEFRGFLHVKWLKQFGKGLSETLIFTVELE